jgi:hypothetical protein
MRAGTRHSLLLVYFGVPLLLLGLVARFAAIPVASPSDYWAVACGSQPNEIPERLRYSSRVGLYPEEDGWLYYFAQEHHGQPVFRVEAENAAQSPPLLLAAPESDLCAHLEWREAQWCEDSRERQALCSPSLTGKRLDQRGVIELHRQLVADLSSEERTSFSDRLNRARLRPVAIAFEAGFILSWQLFLILPWLRGSSAVIKALHLSLAPLLLFLPFYLGYAPLAFTYGPSGGLLYPLYLLFVSLPLGAIPCTSIDRVVLGALPRILGSLSQLPGPPAAITFYACIGPIACLVGGVAASATYLLASRIGAKLLARTRRPTRR